MFVRTASYSNRRPESHPDYLAVFKNLDATSCAFVEVKSPKESIGPSQRQFFPELVREAGQRVMLVRLTDAGENARFLNLTLAGTSRHIPFRNKPI